MQSLGLIETRGLLAAIEGADVMLKTAQVELVARTFVGGGLVTIAVSGEVAAVKAAVEAGAAAVEKISPLSLVSQHVIPRPHPDIEGIVKVKEKEPMPKQDMVKEPIESAMATGESTNLAPISLQDLNKKEVDAFIQKFGLAKGVNALKLFSVVKLRRLAREYKELDLAGRAISKANKDLLIKKLSAYYQGQRSN